MSGGACLDATARSRKARILKERTVFVGARAITRVPYAIIPNGPLTPRQKATRVQALHDDLHTTFQRWYPGLSPSRKDRVAA